MNQTRYIDKPNLANQKFVIVFYRMIQTIRLHHDNNQLIKQCTAQFAEILGDIFNEDKLSCCISHDCLYIQGEPLRERKGSLLAIQDFIEFLKQRHLKGFIFYPSIKSIPAQDIVSFVRLLIESARYENPAVWLAQKIKRTAIDWVEALETSETEEYGHVRPMREQALDAYSQSIVSVKETVRRLSMHGHTGIRKAKRMMQKMSDFVREDETLLLGLSTIRDYDDYTYTHSVNVAILSMCLGNRIGISRHSLCHLGISGLFHDLGKVDVSTEIINKPDKLSDEEFREIQKHPFLSVRQILNLNTSHEMKSKIIVGPFEHHLNYDLSGYPLINAKKSISLFGSILQIADVYDAITSPRAYRPCAYSPDQALGMMLKESGKQFHPILLKIFIAMMGSYPVGTLLLLDSGEMGIVMDYPLNTENSLPRIVLLANDGNGGTTKGEIVDLAENNLEGGTFKRSIVRSLQPANYGIKPSEFII